MNVNQALLNAITELAEGVEKHASTLGVQHANLRRLLTDPNRHPEINQAMQVIETTIEDLVLTATDARSIINNLDDNTPAPTVGDTAPVVPAAAPLPGGDAPLGGPVADMISEGGPVLAPVAEPAPPMDIPAPPPAPEVAPQVPQVPPQFDTPAPPAVV